MKGRSFISLAGRELEVAEWVEVAALEIEEQLRGNGIIGISILVGYRRHRNSHFQTGSERIAPATAAAQSAGNASYRRLARTNHRGSEVHFAEGRSIKQAVRNRIFQPASVNLSASNSGIESWAHKAASLASQQIASLAAGRAPEMIESPTFCFFQSG